MSSDAVPLVPPAALSQRRILLFWLPLALSWLLMGLEGPMVNAVIARLNGAERTLAALGLVMSICFVIESPIINLLSTSTALARSAQNYRQLRRFSLQLMLLVTLIQGLIGWTPLFDIVVRGWLGAPETLIEPVRLGLRAMLVWSAAVAWRRFCQGLLIRFGRTRFVGQGTLVRLAAIAATAVALALAGAPGMLVAVAALNAGVICEAAYAHWAARPIVQREFGPDAPRGGQPELTYLELLRFHTPLAASTLLFLLAQPLISAALARGPEPEVVLAAWPITSNALFLVRAPAVALPEVIIALVDQTDDPRPLRVFSQRVGLACTAALALLGFTPLGTFYFQGLIGVGPHLSARAVSGLQAAALLPLLVGVQSWFRGALTARRVTLAITQAVVLHLSVLAASLVIGVALDLPGVPLAGLALSLAVLAETGLLWVGLRRSEPHS